jgi:hypothetical protein
VTGFRHRPDVIAYFANKPAPPGCKLFNPVDDQFIAYLERKYTSSIDRKRHEDISASLPDAITNYVRLHPVNNESFIQPDRQLETATMEAIGESEVAFGYRSQTLAMIMHSFRDKKTVTSIYEVPVLLLPSLELNAFTLLSPQRRPAIILNFYLWTYLSQIANTVYAASGISYDRGELREWRHSLKEFAEHLVCLALVAMTGKSEFLAGSPAGKDYPIWGGQLGCAAGQIVSQFILLHEYGHIIFGDLDDADGPKPVFTDADGKPLHDSAIGRSSAKEIRADLWATYVLSQYPNETNPPSTKTERYSVVAVFFRFLEICDLVRAHLLHLPVRPQGHPPAHIRLLNVLDNLGAPEIDLSFVTTLLSPFDEALTVLRCWSAGNGPLWLNK